MKILHDPNEGPLTSDWQWPRLFRAADFQRWCVIIDFGRFYIGLSINPRLWWFGIEPTSQNFRWRAALFFICIGWRWK